MSSQIRKITFPVSVSDQIFCRINEREGIIKINNVERFSLSDNQIFINGVAAGVISENVGITLKSFNAKYNTFGTIPYRDAMQFVLTSNSVENQFLEINDKKYVFLGSQNISKLEALSDILTILPFNKLFITPKDVNFSKNIILEITDSIAFFNFIDIDNNEYTLEVFENILKRTNETDILLSNNLKLNLYQEIEIWLYGLDTKKMTIGREEIEENSIVIQEIIL